MKIERYPINDLTNLGELQNPSYGTIKFLVFGNLLRIATCTTGFLEMFKNDAERNNLIASGLFSNYGRTIEYYPIEDGVQSCPSDTEKADALRNEIKSAIEAWLANPV